MATGRLAASQSGLGDEPFDVLASDQRDMFTEPFPIEADQSMPMAVLLVAHRLQRLRRCRVILMDSLRQVCVNSPVFLLGLDRESKDLLGRKIFEPFGQVSLYGASGYPICIAETVKLGIPDPRFFLYRYRLSSFFGRLVLPDWVV